jgi:hypothetical protein
MLPAKDIRNGERRAALAQLDALAIQKDVQYVIRLQCRFYRDLHIQTATDVPQGLFVAWAENVEACIAAGLGLLVGSARCWLAPRLLSVRGSHGGYGGTSCSPVRQIDLGRTGYRPIREMAASVGVDPRPGRRRCGRGRDEK